METSTLLGRVLSGNQIPDVPLDRVAWIDRYGNIKTTIPSDTVLCTPESKVVIRIGDVANDAVFSDS